MCFSNSELHQCISYPNPINVIQRVSKPTISLPQFIQRGTIVDIQSNVTADNYFWTMNVPELEMELKDSGLKFVGEVDTSVNNEATQSFYLNRIGVSRIGLYVYNVLSWEYVEKTVYVESPVVNVPVSFDPDEYAKAGETVKLTITCPGSSYQNITITTSESQHVVQCLKLVLENSVVFATPGEQTISIRTYNNISSVEQEYFLVIQEEVLLNFTVSSAGISPNNSVAVGSWVTFVAVSPEVFQPLPDLRVQWSVSGSVVETTLLQEEENSEISTVNYMFDEVYHVTNNYFYSKNNFTKIDHFLHIFQGNRCISRWETWK